MSIIGITLYSKFAKSSEESSILNARQTTDQFVMSLDYYLRGMMDISDSINNIIYYSQDIKNERLPNQMDVLRGSRKDIVSVAVFSKNGELLVGVPSSQLKYGVNNITSQDWFMAPLKEPANLYVSSPHVQNLFRGQHSWVISLSREITYSQNGHKYQGVLVMDINFSSMDQLCQGVKLGKKGYICIIDQYGSIVFHPKQQLINIGLKNENTEGFQTHVLGQFFDKFEGEDRLITIQTMYYTRWRVVGIAYMDELVTTQKNTANYVGLTILLAIFFNIIVSAVTSAKIAKPIKKLQKSMKMVEDGQLDINVDIKGEEEVVKLAQTFNMMLMRIRKLLAQVLQEQEEKRKSELDALQAQINPHFLYNTLDSIVWMAENEKNEDVITMVTSLARFFRISISRGKNVITIEEELEHARNYMIIQKMRYKNKFWFKIEAEKDTLHCKTLKLILQPLLENALYHGIEYMVDEGYINISVKKVEGKILFQVSDNGLGMSPEKLETLLLAKSKENSGVGVKNVHERIKLFYGNEYGLEIESQLEVGTNVKIWIPIIEDYNGGTLK